MKTITLSDAEFRILGEFLERLSDVMGNAGCNDFYLDKKMIQDKEFIENYNEYLIEVQGVDPAYVVDLDDTEPLTSDSLLIEYIRDRLNE